MFSYLRDQTIMSGQLHTPVASSPRKVPSIPTGQDAGSASDPAWTLWERDTFLIDSLYGLVIRVPGYRSRGAGFDSRHYQLL
jgi:hypothetical protein